MELLTGKSEKQLVHLKPADVYSPEAAAKVIETDEKVFRHNVSLTYEQWLDYPDGRKACFEIRKVPYYDRVGKRHGLMGFGRDITERKRYQDALERASRDKTTFISTIVTRTAYTAERYRRPEPYSAGYRTHRRAGKISQDHPCFRPSRWGISLTISTWIRWNGARSSLIINRLISPASLPIWKSLRIAGATKRIAL